MDENTECPTCRATIRDGSLTLHAWQPWLIRGGPARVHIDALAERGVALADLTNIEGDDGNELIVQWLPWEAGGAEATAVLEAWAATVGYRRVWFPGGVVEVDVQPMVELAGTTCAVCGCEWNDSGPDFWQIVREQGWFPTNCFACGGSMPEWTMRPGTHPGESGGDAGVSQPERTATCGR